MERFGEWEWRFPDWDASAAMLLYIDDTVTGGHAEEDLQLLLEFLEGEHRDPAGSGPERVLKPFTSSK